MRHLDLFSGIGGFALAADEVWRDEQVEHTFVEIDRFCQQVLAKNFPGSTIYGDIKTVTGTRGQEGVDLITGGFPCQPFSAAGKRRGTADDRHLWPEMLRVIQEFRPSWVIAENVGGLVTWSNGLVFEQVCVDLEAQGYEVQPFVIPAVSVNAPHRRDRVWFVARNAQHYGQHGAEDTPGRAKGGDGNAARSQEVQQPEGASSLRNNVANSRRKRRGSGHGSELQPEVQEAVGAHFDVSSWQRDWQEVAFATCIPRVDDGLPPRVVRLPDGTTISEARWRKEAIKAYGNAIVPQVAMEIMKAIKEVMEANRTIA